MTKAQVNKHLATKKQALADAKDQQSLPAVYAVAKPVLLFLSTFTFIPAKWRDVMKALIQILDLQTLDNGS